MWFKRMPLEDWFDTYQYAVDYDIGESAVKCLTLGDIDIDPKAILLRYGHHKGKPELREAVAAQYEGFSADDVLVTSGASEANFCVVSALVKPGDHVVVEHPNYPSLYEVPRSLGCDVSLFTLEFEKRFKPDLDVLKRMVKPDTKLVSFTHPNNPTGSKISEDDLKRVIDLVETLGTYLMFDETYREMDLDDPLPPAATYSSRVISITSMSKCFGLPGIRIGWLATKDRSILESVLAIREQVSITNGAVSEEVAIYVLNNNERFLDSARRRIEKNKAVVSRWISEQDDFEWIEPEAGVVCFPRIKLNVNVEPEKLYRTLAEDYKTFVLPGRCFEMDNRHFRVGFGADAEEIETGLGNVVKALNELRS
jgi:aspartate/methionine/tyrosine aminotransferase